MAEIRNIFDVAGRSMAAQMVRLNTVASNLANAGAVSGNKENAFRALKPVFETKFADALKRTGLSTVDAVDVKETTLEPERVYMPSHPDSDLEGYVFRAAVDENEEMVEMLEASRQYQNNIEVVSTMRSLMMRTINMGK